jgi:hypothetical protein
LSIDDAFDVLDPETPPGLPYGDKAALAQVENDAGGLVFFIDGDKACTPIQAPPALLALMQEVATAEINHEGPACKRLPKGNSGR